MARIGYARVSTIDQDLEGQLARLKAEGCEIIRSEKVSGVSRVGRTELENVITFLRLGECTSKATDLPKLRKRLVAPECKYTASNRLTNYPGHSRLR